MDRPARSSGPGPRAGVQGAATSLRLPDRTARSMSRVVRGSMPWRGRLASSNGPRIARFLFPPVVVRSLARMELCPSATAAVAPRHLTGRPALGTDPCRLAGASWYWRRTGHCVSGRGTAGATPPAAPSTPSTAPPAARTGFTRPVAHSPHRRRWRRMARCTSARPTVSSMPCTVLPDWRRAPGPPSVETPRIRGGCGYRRSSVSPSRGTKTPCGSSGPRPGSCRRAKRSGPRRGRT